MGKALAGKLSCMSTGPVVRMPFLVKNNKKEKMLRQSKVIGC